MARYFYEVSVGPGMSRTGIIDSDGGDDSINEWLRDQALDNASDFGFDTDEDHFGDLDTVGREWDDELDDYEEQSELIYYYEDYDPEEHNNQVYNPEDIEYL